LRGVDFFDQGTLRPNLVVFPQFSQTAILPVPFKTKLTLKPVQPGNITINRNLPQGKLSCLWEFQEKMEANF
jgi:hypothetical protein